MSISPYHPTSKCAVCGGPPCGFVYCAYYCVKHRMLVTAEANRVSGTIPPVAPDWRAESERLEKERNALEAECVMLRLARNTVTAQAELDRTNYVEQTRKLTAEVERWRFHVEALRPPPKAALTAAAPTAERVPTRATPVCKCGAPADPTFYSPVSGDRCTACAYRMVGKVPPGEWRFYRGEYVAAEPMSWPRAIGLASLIVGAPIALGALVANHAEIAHLANLLWGLAP